MRVPCPSCRQLIELEEDFKGPVIACPYCQQTTRVDETTSRKGGAKPRVRAGTSAKPHSPTLDRFQLRRLLGQGGFGRVYLAYDPLLDREVALKVIEFQQTAYADQAERFLREVRASANLSHPNVVRIHDARREGRYAWIIAEFVRGTPLHQFSRAQRLSFVQIAELVAQLADALAYAH